MFTVWYICTHVACDSRYTLSTVRKLTPIAAAVLSRGLSIVIKILPTFFSSSKSILTSHNIASCMSFRGVGASLYPGGGGGLAIGRLDLYNSECLKTHFHQRGYSPS